MRAVLVPLALLATAALAQDVPRPDPLLPGIAFETGDAKKLQEDSFANPGMLWVQKGEQLFGAKPATGPACSQCHKVEAMKDLAAKYPRHDPSLGKVVTLAGRVDACNRRNQKGPGFAPESEPLLALTTWLTHLSEGQRILPDTSAPTKRLVEKGGELYRQRLGQMNLACTHCHDASWGKTLREQKISQGHPVGWPAYRLEWQALGSLERRLRACYFGVRAEQPAYGSEELLALQAYLAARAKGMPVQAPGVRR